MLSFYLYVTIIYVLSFMKRLSISIYSIIFFCFILKILFNKIRKLILELFRLLLFYLKILILFRVDILKI